MNWLFCEHKNVYGVINGSRCINCGAIFTSKGLGKFVIYIDPITKEQTTVDLRENSKGNLITYSKAE